MSAPTSIHGPQGPPPVPVPCTWKPLGADPYSVPTAKPELQDIEVLRQEPPSTGNDTELPQLINPATPPPKMPTEDELWDMLDQMKEQVYRDAYAEGLEEARRQVAAEAALLRQQLNDEAAQHHAARTQEHRQALDSLEAASVTLRNEERLVVQDMEHAALQLALGFAEAVVGHAISIPETVIERVKDVLALAPPRGPATIRLSPHDAATIDEAAISQDRTIVVRADPNVERGSCVVEVGDCTIDAQISTALQRLRAQAEGILDGSLPAPANPGT